MRSINKPERATQDRVIKLFTDCWRRFKIEPPQFSVGVNIPQEVWSGRIAATDRGVAVIPPLTRALRSRAMRPWPTAAWG